MDDEIFNKLKAFIFEQGFKYTLSFPLLFKKKKITRENAIKKGAKYYDPKSKTIFLEKDLHQEKIY